MYYKYGAIAAVLALLGVCFLSRSEPTLKPSMEESIVSISGGEGVATGAELIEAFDTGGRAGDTIFDHEDYRLYVYYEVGDKEFEMVFVERDPATGARYRSSFWYTTSYSLNYIAPQPNGDLFAIGWNAIGKLVIERFDFSMSSGAYQVTLTEYDSSTIGQALPMTELGLEIVDNAFKIPGKNRDRRWLSVNRSLIYIGVDIASVLGGEADPEGRFVLVMDKGRKVFQVAAERGAVPTIVVEASDTPAMGRANGMIGVFRHLTMNRVYMMHTASHGRTRVMLIDSNNDGLFEGPIEYQPQHAHFSPTPQTFEEGLMHYYRSTTQ